MKKVIGLLVLCFIINSSLSAQNLFSAELQKNSSLIISGSTNLLSFKLYQKGEKLSKNKLIVATTQSQNKVFISQNQLLVLVKNFDSNNGMALKDFLKLLKSLIPGWAKAVPSNSTLKNITRNIFIFIRGPLQ